MSDDTQNTPFESVQHHQISADDPSLDALVTITVIVAKGDKSNTIKFMAKPHEFETSIDSRTLPVHEDDVFSRPTIRPGKLVSDFNLTARITPSPDGIMYSINAEPPG